MQVVQIFLVATLISEIGLKLKIYRNNLQSDG